MNITIDKNLNMLKKFCIDCFVEWFLFSFFFSIPPVSVLQEILTSTSTFHITFYEFLIALTRNESLNTFLGKLGYKLDFYINF